MRLTVDEARALGLYAPAEKKRNKYNAQQVKWRGYTFDSKREAAMLIPIMETQRDWVFHPRFRVETSPGVFEVFELDLFWVERHVVGAFESMSVRSHYIDVKGFETERFKRLRPLFEKQYGVKVEIWK